MYFSIHLRTIKKILYILRHLLFQRVTFYKKDESKITRKFVKFSKQNENFLKEKNYVQQWLMELRKATKIMN